MYAPGTRKLVGAEVVIDKDRASALLAEELGADLFVMATDVDAVYRDFGTPNQAPVGRATPQEIRDLDLPAGSMGPKVEAGIAFAEHTGKPAAIGRLAEIRQVIAGERGTRIETAGVAAQA